MKEWAGDFKVLLAGAIDAAERRAKRVMVKGDSATRWLRYHVLAKGRRARSALVWGAASVGYWIAAGVVTSLMLMSTLFAVLCVGVVAFVIHVTADDAS
jgi:hypothetical protein